MTKLNQKKIRWIIREMDKGRLSVWRIAKVQNITPRRARQVYQKYKGVQKPKLLPPGRKPQPITEEEVKTVLELRKEHPLCAVTLGKILDERGEMHINHNRIHRILKENDLANTEPKKSKQRKYIRYQRRHSNSLWHTDYFESPEEKWVIAFEDDASRFVPSFGVFDNATAENAVAALKPAIRYGIPKQLMTDHGSHFMSVEREICPNPGPTVFQKYLTELRIEHIRARVKHPQSNGKVERFWGSIYKYKLHFGTWDAAFEYYNFKRPHMSLENGSLRTPYQAFLDKMWRGPKSI